MYLSMMNLGDCHDPKGLEDMCVAGAVRNYTTQLMHYREGSSDRRCMNYVDENKFYILVILSFNFFT